MKRKIIIAASILFLLFLVGGWVFLRPFHTIRTLDERYKQVERGMTAAQVEEIMKYEGRWLVDKDPIAFWDDARISESEGARIRSTLMFSVSTFYLPVSFEFTFDEQRRVVGRHCYD